MSALFKPNSKKVIEGALRKCGVIAEGESPNADQIATAMDALRPLVKAWQTDGLQTWLLSTALVSAVSGQGTYTSTELSLPKLMRVYHVSALNNTGKNASILNRISIQEYYDLGARFSPGQPNQYCVVDDKEETKINLFPVPDDSFVADYKLTIVYQRPYNDVTGSAETDVLDFPDQWAKALTYGLAADLADEYVLPLRERQWLEAKAKEAKEDAISWSIEDSSVYFRADQRFGWQFRQTGN